MRTGIVAISILFVVQSGCSKDQGSSTDQKGSDAKKQPPPHNADAKYKGQTARQWGEQVLDRDLPSAFDAINALEALGTDGVPYLVQATKKAVYPIDQRAIFSLANHPKLAEFYLDDLEPAIRRELRSDRVPAIAVVMLSGMSKESISRFRKELMHLANSDYNDPKIREQARNLAER